MALPKVTINVSNGNLGRTAASNDGICGLIGTGVAVSGKFALGDVLGPFTSLADAEAKGIDSAYDTTNTCMMWRHIKDFYDEAESQGVKGAKLYVMVVAKTVLMADMTLKTNLTNSVKKLLTTANGDIRIVGVTRIPDGAYVPAYTDQFENDLWTAATNAKALIDEEFSLYRPVSIILEGRNWQGNVATSRDLRSASVGPNANRVAIVMGADPDVSGAAAHANKYAFVGKVLGRLAAIPVQRNIGRVKSGKISVMTKAGFSNNANISTLTETQLGTLNDYGYIFALQHMGKTGFYFNDDHAACPITDDFSSLSRGRVMDKAARITRTVYLEELLDDIQLDPTGKLAASTIKDYQGKIEDAVNKDMTAKGEIVRVSAFVDPDQNVLSTDKVTAQITILPKAISKEIVATLAFENEA